MTTELDGKNIFQWRAAYDDMAAQFTKYASHTADCTSRDPQHQHDNVTKEARAICSESVCNCGVLCIIAVLLHPTRLVYMCPDGPTANRPTRLHTAPIHTDLEESGTWMGRAVFRPKRLELTDSAWCQYDREADCLDVAARFDMPGVCKQPHRVPVLRPPENT